MNEKLTEEKWNEKRELARTMLKSIDNILADVIDLKVLTGAEVDRCFITKFNLHSGLFNYWDERSKVSKERFCEGGGI